MGLMFLFIVSSFPPIYKQNSLRALEISKILIEQDVNPIILTRKLLKRELKDYTLIKEIPRNIEIYKTQIVDVKKRYSLKALFFRITNKIIDLYFYIHWIPFAYISGKKILKSKKDIKFIYSTGPPFYSHIIAFLLKRKYNIPLFIEYRDPWSFNPYFFKENSLKQRLQLKIERNILKSADVIITISSALTLFLKKNFPIIRNKPIYSIPNGLNLKDFPFSERKGDNGIIFTFIGSLYGKRDIIPLLNIISFLKEESLFDNLNFTLKIFGRYNRELLNRIISKLDIHDLIFLGGYLTRSQIFKEIKESTLTVHIGENINYPTISFKVWDYLSCRKKILYLGREDSYTSRFLIKNAFGIIIPLNNLNKGKDVFKNLIIEINQKTFEDAIDKIKIEKFSWDIRVKKLKECIEKNI